MAVGSGIKAGKAFVEVAVRDKLTAGLRAAQKRLMAFGASVRQVGKGLILGGGALAAPFAAAIKVFAGFDDQMRVVRAVTGATEKDFAALTEEAKRLGRTTSFSASQVAAAMGELGRAGFDSGQILDSTESVLALASATSTDLPRAAEIAGAALRGFGLETSEAGRVADVLTATANGSAQTLEDLFEAFKPVAPIAAEAGASIEETAAALAILANNGIKGSLAGNAVARAYKNLSNADTAAMLRSMGVESVDAAGNLRPLSDIINDLAKATAGLGSAEKLSIFETLFGRGQAAALKLASSGTAFDGILESIQNSGGQAIRTAEEMNAGIGGAFRALLSAAEGVAIGIGDAIEPVVRTIAGVLTEVSGVITKMTEKNKGLVAGVAAGVAVVIAAGAVLVPLGVTIGGLALGVGALASVVGIAGTALAAVLTPLGLVAAAVVGLSTQLVNFSTVTNDVVAYFQARFSGIAGIARTTFGGVADAIASGDLALAGQVALAGLKAVFLSATADIRSVWVNFTSDLAGAFLVIEDTVVGVFDRIRTSASNILQSAQTSVAQTITSLSNALGIDEFVLGVDLSDDETRDAVLALEDKLKADTTGREAELRQRMADREKALRDQVGIIEEDRNDRLSSAQRELDEARRRLDELRARAGEGGPADPTDPDAPDAPEPPKLPSGEAVARVIREAVGSKGTFNALAVAGLRTEGVQQQTAKNTKATAESAKRIERRMKNNNGLAFS